MGWVGSDPPWSFMCPHDRMSSIMDPDARKAVQLWRVNSRSSLQPIAASEDTAPGPRDRDASVFDVPPMKRQLPPRG